MAKEEKESKKEKEKSESSNFQRIGKIFLLTTIVVIQGVLAYFLVAKNYSKIYEMANAEEPSIPGVYELEPLVVNPAGTQGKRYLMVEISVEINNIEHIPLLEESNLKIKQDMIDALSSHTVKELTSPEDRLKLREELSFIINNSIGVHSVRNLYFTKYVMQ